MLNCMGFSYNVAEPEVSEGERREGVGSLFFTSPKPFCFFTIHYTPFSQPVVTEHMVCSNSVVEAALNGL